MALSDLFSKVGRSSTEKIGDVGMDIIEYVESPYGLGMTYDISGVELFPVQKFIIKGYYNLPLNNVDRNITVPKEWYHAQSAKPEHYYNFTEAEYMRYLYEEGRCNIREPDHDRREMVLPIGRRSGKSFVTSIIGSYETYRILRKGNPQRYYGLQQGAEITLSTVAPTKDQSQILYNAVKNHFKNCDFFAPYLSHDTQSFMRFQTPHDIEETGDPNDGGRSSYQIRFFSSSSSGIRGHANIVVILDEAAFFKAKGESSAQAVYEAVTPSTATFGPSDPNGRASLVSAQSEGRTILISSPSNKDGLFFNQYDKSKRGGASAENLFMIQAPTWEVNPTVPVGFLTNFHANDPVVFATEFGAEFTDRVSSWIEREEDLLVCLDFDRRAEMRGKARQVHYMGLDLAIKNDRSTIVLTRPEGDNIKLVYHEEWQAGESWYDLNPHLSQPFMPYAKKFETEEKLDFEELAKWVKEVCRRFYIEAGIFDQWEGQSFQQTLDKLGLNQIRSKKFTQNETSMMFDAFKTLMFHERLDLYDYVVRDVESDEDNAKSVLTGKDSVKHAPYITELLELSAEKKSKKVIKVEAPSTPGKHDDFSDSLIRSVWLSMQEAVEGSSYIAGRNGAQQEQVSRQPATSTAYHARKQRNQNTKLQRGGRLAQLQRFSRRRNW
jgi:hypothetical protein